MPIDTDEKSTFAQVLHAVLLVIAYSFGIIAVTYMLYWFGPDMSQRSCECKCPAVEARP